MALRNLLETNVGAVRLRNKPLLLYGTCIEERYPEILEDFKKDREPIHICLETFHMDHVGYKLANIIKYSKISELTILTIDGSPHCYQLHVLGQDLIRHFTPELKVEHWVIEKGKLYKIPYQVITVARHLHKVKKLVENSEKD
ncbi:MAG: 4Fe-4S ferredoxin [Candidatus Helarchaeota archaeon]